MRAAARLEENVERWKAVSKETEAGLVLVRDMSDGAKIIGWKNIGSWSEQARADSAKTLGWTYVEAQ